MFKHHLIKNSIKSFFKSFKELFTLFFEKEIYVQIYEFLSVIFGYVDIITIRL